MTDALTIVLTLKDRSDFTRRWMRRMNDAACLYPIVIADGGADESIERELRTSSRYPHLRYEYIRYPFDADHHSYYRKLADVVALIKTPYALLADNDDFFLLEQIPAMLRFLDANADYVSCGGRRVTLQLMAGTNAVGRTTGDRYEARVDLRPKSVTHRDRVERMRYFLDNVRRQYLWASWYAIHRTQALAAATAAAYSQTFRDPVAHELHVHLSLLAEGCRRELEEPFFINQAGSSQFTSTLEARGSVAERFAASNADEDVIRSLESIEPPLSVAEKAELGAAIARWLSAQQGKSSAPEVRPIALPELEPYILSA